MKKTLIILLLFAPIVCLAQQDTLITTDDVEELIPKPAIKVEKGKVFEVVEEMPEYKGGKDSLFVFIAKKIVYPTKALEAGIQGMVFLKFVVEPDGKVSNIRAVRTFDRDCTKEAIRVIKLTSGKWNPGRKRGKKKRVYVVQPIAFKIN